jgi:hypothetical protein
LEGGHNTRDANEPMSNLCLQLKSCMKGTSDFDSAIQFAFHLGENSGRLRVLEEVSAPHHRAMIASDEASCTDANDAEHALLWRRHMQRIWLTSSRCRKWNEWSSTPLVQSMKSRSLELFDLRCKTWIGSARNSEPL